MPEPRRAPAFSIEISDEPAWAALQAGVAALAGAGLCAWAGDLADIDARIDSPGLWIWLLLALLTVVGCGALAWRLARQPDQRLRWDGQAWWLARRSADGTMSAERAVRLSVVADLDTWLLLRARAADPPDGVVVALRQILIPGHLSLSRGRHGAAWPQLRATLHAARPSPGGPDRI